MVKGMKVGRPGFEKLFAVVNSFHAKVDYSQTKVLGDIHEADEEHDGIHSVRIRRDFPKGVGTAKLCFARPRQQMSLGQSINLAMDFGLRPAIHHEVMAVMQESYPEQVRQLFDLADMAMFEHGIQKKAMELSILSMGSSVTGMTGELIPVHEVVRSCGRICRVHLRKVDMDANMFSAQLSAFVSV